MDQNEISEVNSGRKYICFDFFDVWALNFSLKEKTIRNIHNQTVDKLVDDITVFYTQGLGTCYGDKGDLVWHLFSLVVLKPSLLHLI